MSDSSRNFINDIDTYTLWDPNNLKYPDIGHNKLPDKLIDIKVFPLYTLMAELPVNSNLQPMEFSTLVGSIWFYVFFDFGSDNYIWNLYYDKQNYKKVRKYVLWLLVRLSKKVWWYR